MTLEEMLDQCGLSVDEGVCDICNAINGWANEIDRISQDEFPVEWVKYCAQGKGISWNSDLRLRRKELWAKHEVPCVGWSYDDSGGQMCFRHWIEIAEKLKQP
jgi:hypothetical protein